MSEKWLVLHGEHHVFLFCVEFSETLRKVAAYWTVHLERARPFPSESATNAVIEELMLEDVAEPCVICTSDS